MTKLDPLEILETKHKAILLLQAFKKVMTFQNLAVLCELNISTVFRILSGQVDLNLETANKIIEKLESPLGEGKRNEILKKIRNRV